MHKGYISAVNMSVDSILISKEGNLDPNPNGFDDFMIQCNIYSYGVISMRVFDTKTRDFQWCSIISALLIHLSKLFCHIQETFLVMKCV